MIKIYLFLFIIFFQNLFSFSIDKKVPKSDSIILTSHYEVPYLMSYALIGVSIIEGNSDSRFGKTTIKALDSFVWTNIATELFKRTFQRTRPRNSGEYSEWFNYGQGSGANSFPSGHVSSVTGSVVPYILEYQKDTPLIHLLWLFPIQQMAGRVNEGAHWQTDVLAGALLGGLIGWYSFTRESPLIFYFDNDGVYTGLKYRF